MRNNYPNSMRKIIKFAIITAVMGITVSSEAFFCPAPPKPSFNSISGVIKAVNEPDYLFHVTFNMVRIWVNGTMYFSVANQKGYFYFANVYTNKIKLRFEYFGAPPMYLDLGDVGLNKTIFLDGVTLEKGTASCDHVSIEPFNIEGKEEK